MSKKEKQAVTAFKPEEIYLTLSESNDVKTWHYKMKYHQQRDLFLEMLIFARQLAKRRTIVDSENITNPNYQITSKKSAKGFLKNFLKAEAMSTSDEKSLKTMMNDRIAPPKILFKCQVTKKVSGLRASEKRMWLFVGVTNILISKYNIFVSSLNLFEKVILKERIFNIFSQ